MDPYLSVLVDELLSLTEFPVYDLYCSAPVKVKVALIQYFCDIPAHSKVMHLSGHNGLRSCPYCLRELSGHSGVTIRGCQGVDRECLGKIRG